MCVSGQSVVMLAQKVVCVCVCVCVYIYKPASVYNVCIWLLSHLTAQCNPNECLSHCMGPQEGNVTVTSGGPVPGMTTKDQCGASGLMGSM